MRITIVGTGYVGLTTGVCLASVGHEVICVDILAKRVSEINAGLSPFYEPGLADLLRTTVDSGRLRASMELADAVATSEITLITVGTPDKDQGIDLSYVSAAAQQIGTVLRSSGSYHVVAVKSTVLPSTTDTLVRGILEEGSGRKAGEFGLCMNPEFLREGSAIDDFMNPDRIVIGQWDERSGQVLAEMYSSFDCPRVFTTLRNAEMIKYASNALLATMISFSNEIAEFCEVTPDTDVRAVLDGVRLDRRLSPMVDGQRISPGILSFLWAGCGYGGSCLPKDVNALRAYARDHAATPHLLDAVVAVNANRPARLAALAEEALGSLKGTTVAVLGLAFKPDTDDVRQSPAANLIDVLCEKDAAVKAYDPVVTSLSNHSRGSVTVCSSPEQALRDADAVLIVTAWPEFSKFDWATLCGTMRNQIIIDGRNALNTVSWPKSAKYINIGRVSADESKQSAVFSQD